MDVGGHQGGGRHRFDNFREERSVWNAVNHHHIKEQSTLNINRKLLTIVAERDAAIEERNRALVEKKKALEEREAAISLRNSAIRERNDAILERDNALSAFQQSMIHHPTIKRLPYNPGSPCSANELQILDALCRTVVTSECNNEAKRQKDRKEGRQKKVKRMGEDINGFAAADQLKFRNDWDGQNIGLNRVDFDQTIMAIPGCSCTGVFRHCYKWGNGGWQSSCCTTTLSIYPLPPVPNKRYARMGGRKMSGSAFSKLLTRLASQGYDFSLAVDLIDHWSKHGTNRYIKIK